MEAITPFIGKFLCSAKKANDVQQLHYSSESEMMVYDAAGVKLVIDDSLVLAKTGGSFLTDSYGDPTRDESTDR